VPFLFIEDLTDYENHVGYRKLHKRRAEFCELNSAASWRVLIGGFNHNSFLDINYYLGENEADRLDQKQNLDLVFDYMDRFLDTYLLGLDQRPLQPKVTDSLQVFGFKQQ